MRASPLGRQRCPLGTTCERLGRLAADDRNRTAKRARVDRRAGRLLVVRSGRLVRLSADDRIEAEAEPQRSTTKLSTKIEAEIASSLRPKIGSSSPALRMTSPACGSTPSAR
jgi:hypothetical protein